MMGKKHKKHKSDKKSSDGMDGAEDSAGFTTTQGQTTDASDKGEKPLKLVLKVGPSESSETFGSQPGEERTKHKHKKKKKKKEGREREREEGGSSQKRALPEEVKVVGFSQGGSSSQKRALPEEVKAEAPSEEPPQKKPTAEGDVAGNDDDGETIEDRVRHSPRACVVRTDDGAILRQCLEYLQKSLQAKDVNGFFAFPVTDSIAPGYSSIIHNPMDFSTMETKIERNEYHNVMEYKKDFLDMCNNAMTYNRPETVYYKEAKRLFHIGAKLLSKEKLLTMKKTQSWLANLTLAEIGIDEQGRVLEDLPPIPEEVKPKEKPKSKSTKTVGTPFEPFPDSLTPEEILLQAQLAAKEARQELSMRNPNTDMVFFRRDKKGVTTLNILNPEDEGIVSNTERVVSIGELVGKLQAGTGTTQSFKEDKRNKVTPVQYVSYGPFSSFAPQYDSSFASVNKEESDLLLATYGDETGVQYAKSVQSFVDSADDCAVKMVNNLLDMLTKGQHTRTNHALEQQRKLEKERAAAAAVAAEEAENSTELSPAASEKTPSQGDTGKSDLAEEDAVQKRLSNTAEMIGDLQRAQDARLSQTPPAHLAHCPGPSEREMELAAKVSEGLADLTREATPGDLINVNSVRKAMGIVSPSSTPLNDAESCADGDEGDGAQDETMETAENVASAPESVAASHISDDEEDDDDDDEDDEQGQGQDEGRGEAEEGVSQDPADLSEFFSGSPLQEETSMDGAS